MTADVAASDTTTATDFAYLAHRIHPWEPRTSRTMPTVMGFTNGREVDVGKLVMGMSDREILRAFKLDAWYERTPSVHARGVNPEYVAATREEEAHVVDVVPPVRELQVKRDEPTYSRPPQTPRSVAYAPTLGASALDELYTGYAVSGAQDKAEVVRAVSRILSEDEAYTNVRHIAIEVVLADLHDDECTMGLSDTLLGDVIARTCKAMGREAFWVNTTFGRGKKGPEPKQNFRADKYGAVSVGTYTQRVWRGRAR